MYIVLKLFFTTSGVKGRSSSLLIISLVGGTISLYFSFLILNNAGLSQKPKHVARNKTYKKFSFD